MRHEQYKLVEVDRETLAIEYETSDFNSPNIHRMFWPIGCYQLRGFGCVLADAIGKPAKPCGSGQFSVYLGNGNHLTATLVNGGSTLPVKTEVFPAPKPKCRVETRWQYGQWEKYTKKGWVAA